MPDIIAAIAPPRPKKARQEDGVCDVQVRAEFVSLGGGILFAVCLIISALFYMVISVQEITGVQRFIAIVLFIGSWAYFLNSVTERLSCVGRTLTFKSALNSTRRIPLEELEALILRHEGFNLERGMESLELKRDDHPPDRITLGPCWQQRKLESFVQSVGRAMRATTTIQT